jgi:hypothetical protein
MSSDGKRKRDEKSSDPASSSGAGVPAKKARTDGAHGANVAQAHVAPKKAHASTAPKTSASKPVGAPTKGAKAKTSGAPAPVLADIDALFDSLKSQKEQAKVEAVVKVEKAKRKEKAAAAIAESMKELERQEMHANRIKGADSPVPLR